jgi:hypothetical protein
MSTLFDGRPISQWSLGEVLWLHQGLTYIWNVPPGFHAAALRIVQELEDELLVRGMTKH